MTDEPLNPPKAPMCPIYNELEVHWSWYFRQPDRVNETLAIFTKMSEHRASCELCKARMEEFNELARNTTESEDANES
jgi:hypothetical protein